MINGKGVKRINECINKSEDKDIYNALCIFSEEKVSQVYKSKLTRLRKRTYIEALLYVIEKVYEFNITDISWQSYCVNMQYVKYIDNDYKKPFRDYLRDFYKFVISTILIKTDNINLLVKHIHLLDLDERRVSTASYDNKFISENIITNFPVNSTLEQLYYVDSIHKRGNVCTSATIINLNTKIIFVKKLLISYIEWTKTDIISSTSKALLLPYRIFVYYFQNSLENGNDIKIDCIESICFRTYKKQYQFYKALEEEYGIKSTPHGFTPILKEFYLFLLDFIEINNIKHNLFKNTFIDRDILIKVNFNLWVENGYEFADRSGLGSMPKGDKWLFPDNSKAAANQTPQGFNFSCVKYGMFKDDIKNWVWNTTNLTSPILSSYCRYVIEFINLKYEFEKENLRVIDLSNDRPEELFNKKFMFYYKINIEKEYKNEGTRQNVYKGVKSFLSYHKKKYNVDKTALSLIRFIVPTNIAKRTPVSKDDWKKILDVFQLRKSNSVEEELYYIIFNLKSTTHLRIGEILNLKRNCIIEINADALNPYGIISYYSKSQKGEPKEASLTLDKIRLIERAILITHELAIEASKSSKHNVFLREDNERKIANALKRYKIYKISGSDFKEYFSEVQTEIFNEVKYIPYGLRHMYKSTIWENGSKENISILKLEKMTDTKYYTDRKYYRSDKNLLFYIEAIAGTTISDININGDFINDENEIDKLNPVQQGLGGCKKTECIPSISNNMDGLMNLIDAEDICLICNNFATCYSRIYKFEKRIFEIDKKIEVSNNEYEMNILIAKKKIYSMYYLRLLESTKEV